MTTPRSARAQRSPRFTRPLTVIVSLCVLALGGVATAQALAPVTLSVKAPVSNAAVSGTVVFSGSYAAARNIEIFHNDRRMARASLAGGAWKASVSTDGLPRGAATFVVRGWNSPAGQPFTSTASRSVTVNVGALALAVTSPASGSTVGSPATFSGRYNGARNIEVFRGATRVARATLSNGRWTASVATTGLSGRVTFTFRAWDSLPGQPFTRTLSRTLAVNVGTATAQPTAPAPATPTAPAPTATPTAPPAAGGVPTTTRPAAASLPAPACAPTHSPACRPAPPVTR